MFMIFFPAIAFPAAHTVFATICQFDSVSSIQPLPMCPDRGIFRAIAGSLTTEVLWDIVVCSRLVCWLVCWARCSRTSIVVANFLPFTAGADFVNVPVIDFKCPAAICSIAVG